MKNYQTDNEQINFDEFKDLFIRLSNQSIDATEVPLINSMQKNLSLLDEYFSSFEDFDVRQTFNMGMELMYANEKNLPLYCLLSSFGFNVLYNCVKAHDTMRKILISEFNSGIDTPDDDLDLLQSISNRIQAIQERVKQF